MSSLPSPLFQSPLEIKKLIASGEFTGYASTYHVDAYKDQMMPGAFSYTLQQWQKKEKLPLLLWNHRLDEPVGYWKKMEEDAKGLYVEGQLLLDLERAREVYTLIKAKVLEGLSIGFQPILARTEATTGIRKIYQVHLLEVSLVTLPANASAGILAFKHTTSLPSLRHTL